MQSQSLSLFVGFFQTQTKSIQNDCIHLEGTFSSSAWQVHPHMPFLAPCNILEGISLLLAILQAELKTHVCGTHVHDIGVWDQPGMGANHHVTPNGKKKTCNHSPFKPDKVLQYTVYSIHSIIIHSWSLLRCPCQQNVFMACATFAPSSNPFCLHRQLLYNSNGCPKRGGDVIAASSAFAFGLAWSLPEFLLGGAKRNRLPTTNQYIFPRSLTINYMDYDYDYDSDYMVLWGMYFLNIFNIHASSAALGPSNAYSSSIPSGTGLDRLSSLPLV